MNDGRWIDAEAEKQWLALLAQRAELTAKHFPNFDWGTPKAGIGDGERMIAEGKLIIDAMAELKQNFWIPDQARTTKMP